MCVRGVRDRISLNQNVETCFVDRIIWGVGVIANESNAISVCYSVKDDPFIPIHCFRLIQIVPRCTMPPLQAISNSSNSFYGPVLIGMPKTTNMAIRRCMKPHGGATVNVLRHCAFCRNRQKTPNNQNRSILRMRYRMLMERCTVRCWARGMLADSHRCI